MSKPHRSNVTSPNLLLLAAFLGCGAPTESASGPPADVSEDPRCNALCSDTPPSHEGLFAVCSTESLLQCADLCEVRIADVSGLCAECLLEDAEFDSPDEDALAHEVCLDDGTCYLGLSQWCSGGCWRDGQSTSCDSDISCGDEAVRPRYDEQVDAGSACVFDEADVEGRDDCYEARYPRTQSACSVEFAEVAPCAAICGT